MFENNTLNEEIKEILGGHIDVKGFYMIVMAFVFNDFESFEVREDIIVPEKADDGGAVLAFGDGRIVYFKIQKDELTDDEFDSILEVCYFLQDKFGGRVDAYVLCSPDVELRVYDAVERSNILIHLSSLKAYDGDSILESLENKCMNDEDFTFEDRVNHILLPYMNCQNRDEFESRLQHYLFNASDDENPVFEAVNF